jgi:hypothetical protein
MVMALVVAQHEELVGKPALVVRPDALQVAHAGGGRDTRLVHDVGLDLDRGQLR